MLTNYANSALKYKKSALKCADKLKKKTQNYARCIKSRGQFYYFYSFATEC